jgi:hypothetical protein
MTKTPPIVFDWNDPDPRKAREGDVTFRVWLSLRTAEDRHAYMKTVRLLAVRARENEAGAEKLARCVNANPDGRPSFTDKEYGPGVALARVDAEIDRLGGGRGALKAALLKVHNETPLLEKDPKKPRAWTFDLEKALRSWYARERANSPRNPLRRI